MTTVDGSGTRALEQQFERISWALFFIMIGGIGLVPAVPDGTCLIGTGLILLGLNAARYLNNIRPGAFTMLLGIAAIVFGLARVVGSDLPVLPIALILIGASIIWRTAREHQHR